MKKKVFSILFAIILIFAIKNTCQAANASISCDDNATVGKPMTIKVTGSGVQWNLELKANGKSIAQSSELDNVNGNKSIAFSGTYTPESEGTVEFSLTGSVTEMSDGKTIKSFSPKSVAVKAKETTSSQNNSSSNNQSNGTTQSNTRTNASSSTANKSTEARLKNMGIKEKAYDFTGFKRDRKEYSIEVPNKITSLTVYATPVDSKSKVAGTGKVTLKEGDNTVAVTVTAEAGNTETYTLKIKRKTAAEEASGDSDETLTDNVSGAFGLSSLDIDDVNLRPEFDTEIYQYTIDLKQDLSKLEIETIPTADDTTVEIFGNENLHEGENLITILVKNKKTGQTATYQITVNKTLSADEGNGSEQVEEFSWLKPSTWGKEEIIKAIIIAVLAVLIIIAIILKVKLVKEKRAENNIEFPGADELDRAIAEHQELSEWDEDDADANEFDDFDSDSWQVKNDKDLENNYWQQEENETSDSELDDSDTNYLEDIAKSRNYNMDYQDDFNDKSKKKGRGKHF